MGVWGLVRVRIWVSAAGGAVGMDSGKLRVGKTEMFGAVKGCPGMAGLGGLGTETQGDPHRTVVPPGLHPPGRR